MTNFRNDWISKELLLVTTIAGAVGCVTFNQKPAPVRCATCAIAVKSLVKGGARLRIARQINFNKKPLRCLCKTNINRVTIRMENINVYDILKSKFDFANKQDQKLSP